MRTLNTALRRRSAFAGMALALIAAPSLSACGAEVTNTGEPTAVSITTAPTTTTVPAAPTVHVVGATPPAEESTVVNAPIEAPSTVISTSPSVLAPPAPPPEPG